MGLSKTMNNISRKVTIIAMVVLGISSFGYHFYLTQQIYSNAPKTPNLASGEVVEMNDHGKIFYITEQNNVFNFISIPVGVGFLMLATFVSKKWKPSD
jgi:hypothetical protein